MMREVGIRSGRKSPSHNFSNISGPYHFLTFAKPIYSNNVGGVLLSQRPNVEMKHTTWFSLSPVESKALSRRGASYREHSIFEMASCSLGRKKDLIFGKILACYLRFDGSRTCITVSVLAVPQKVNSQRDILD